MVTDALKLRTLRDCRDGAALRHADHTISRKQRSLLGLMGQCSSIHPQIVERESNQYETGCKLVYMGNVYILKY